MLNPLAGQYVPKAVAVCDRFARRNLRRHLGELPPKTYDLNFFLVDRTTETVLGLLLQEQHVT